MGDHLSAVLATHQTQCLLWRLARESRPWTKQTINELEKALSVTFAFLTGSAKPCPCPMNGGEELPSGEAQHIDTRRWFDCDESSPNRKHVWWCLCSSVQAQSAVSGGAKSLSLLATLEVVWVSSDLGRDTEERIKKIGQTPAELEKTTLSWFPCCCVPLFSPLPSLCFMTWFPLTLPTGPDLCLSQFLISVFTQKTMWTSKHLSKHCGLLLNLSSRLLFWKWSLVLFFNAFQ